jgi:N-acetylneuraminate synthase
MKPEDANLKMITTLQDKFMVPVGYSGHEVGIAVSCAAIALGVTSLERHITLDRSMYGSDQSASLEIAGLEKLVKYVRAIEAALGDGVKRITDVEKKVAKSLRSVDTL